MYFHIYIFIYNLEFFIFVSLVYSVYFSMNLFSNRKLSFNMHNAFVLSQICICSGHVGEGHASNFSVGRYFTGFDAQERH